MFARSPYGRRVISVAEFPPGRPFGDDGIPAEDVDQVEAGEPEPEAESASARSSRPRTSSLR
jgi:hypothetical protein